MNIEKFIKYDKKTITFFKFYKQERKYNIKFKNSKSKKFIT